VREVTSARDLIISFGVGMLVGAKCLGLTGSEGGVNIWADIMAVVRLPFLGCVPLAFHASKQTDI
jgi:hypothetical protein